jgi:hypothetical protein
VLDFVRALLAGKPNNDQSTYYRLLAAGIIRQDRDGSVRFRCELYKRHLADHLN